MVKIASVIFVAAILIVSVSGSVYSMDDDSSRELLKQGLLGAGTGAIASGASGGDAGKGALIGAGTGAIGGILLDAITKPSSSSRRTAAATQDEYYDDQQEEYYEEPQQESGTQKALKQGLLGAGTGAIASGASGGNAGQGALIGAGTGIIGGILLDSLTQPSQPKKVYKRRPQAVTQQIQTQQNVKVEEEQAGSEGGKKKIIKKYDPTGKLVSEEEVYY
ncbi:MAG: glycine zipper family protein [Candidatus Omnitrophica bacterium]|nr:glycine zipper family protein [Candidatus Omnitrophota bacterium]